MANKDIKADELEKYLTEAEEEMEDEAEEEAELEREEVEETPKEVHDDELSEPELTEEEETIEPQGLSDEEETEVPEDEEEPELPEEKVEEEEEPEAEEEEEEIEVEEKSKEEFEEEMEEEIKAEEESKPEEPEEPQERELLAIEKISCESLATINNYFIGITAIEYAFYVTLNMLLSAIVVIKTELTGFFENTKALLIQGVECFAFVVVLFLVASLFNNILRQREGKLGLTILFLSELVLLGCFLAQIIAVVRAVLIF